ncbi:Aldehyde/histidinol dehydrogenase [Phyllosticta citriasiana]|uniref:Aldehyde/histidinol dehydrogenase n=1 Tax=Phyllosticta citriasiana TaxID=595635 RepID=A0ABR1K8K0_9PEZI
MADVKNSTAHDLARVKSTATDGRLANIFWRQDQLRALHGVLVQHEKDALAAIEHDAPRNTPTEAKLEFYLALSAVKQQYAGLDPQRSLDDEYRIKHGKDAADRRDAVGIVYVDPTAHTLFYSALVALAAAIAAGNCVVLQLETTTLRRVPAVLQTILKAALDPDVYAITPSYPSSLDPSTTVQVLQNGARDNVPIRPHDIVSPTAARVLAIVDRTADVAAAARDLVAARFAFGGRSPYAPDLVLVNEFVKTAFLEAAVRETIRFLATDGSGKANGVANGDVKPRREKDDAELAELKAAEGVRIVTSGANGAVVEIESRTSPLLSQPQKISTRLLAVHATTSLDDAIDVSNRPLSTPTTSTQDHQQQQQQELPLAAYLFAAPAYAKYAAQFVRAYATFSNHVPSEKLLGPAIPTPSSLSAATAISSPSSSTSAAPPPPYDPTLFTTPHPDFAAASPLSVTILSLLSSPTGTTTSTSSSSSSSSSSTIQSLARQATAPLPPNRKYKKGVGFFEQGILIGLSLTAGPVLVGVVAAAWVGGRWAWGALVASR